MGGSGKSEKITITNDSGRLSPEEIERMVQEAEEFAEEDKLEKDRIDAKNDLETWLFNNKSDLNDKYKSTMEEGDQETALEAVQDAIKWLEDNKDADKEDFTDKEAEEVIKPLIDAAKSAGGSGDVDEDDIDNDDE